jgi:hypothetical protein
MKIYTEAENAGTHARSSSGFAVDTTFVLFFLAVEFGRSVKGFTFDSLFLALTLAIVAVMPYFLAHEEKIEFKNWIAGRALITVFAVALGWMYSQTVGVVLPEMFRFLPMTMLIMTAMICCYIQFYSFFRLRLVK